MKLNKVTKNKAVLGQIADMDLRLLRVFKAVADCGGMAAAELELVNERGREHRMRDAIDQYVEESGVDYVFFDCPPSLGLLTVNAFAAASEVLVPIQAEYYALEGLGQLIRNIDQVQRNLHPELKLGNLVLTMYDGRTRLSQEVAEQVREHFGDKVCRNMIPRSVRLSEAPSYGMPITLFDSSSRAAVAYRELAREVHERGAP